MARFLAVLAGVALSAVCLALAVSWVSWGEFSEAFAELSYGWIAIAVLLQVATLLVRAFRWQLMFLDPPRYATLFWTQAVGYLANNVLPLRLGDVARIVLLRLAVTTSSFRIGYTIAVERFLDIVMTLALLLLAATLASVADRVWVAGGIFLVLVILGTICGIGLYLYGRARGDSLSRPLLKKAVVEFVHAVDATFRNRPLATIALSAACVAGSTLIVWAVLKGFRPDAALGTAMLVTVTVSFALAIPSAPANIGTVQLAGQAALVSLAAVKYSPAEALAIVSVIHGIHFTGTTALGAFGLWWLRRELGNSHLLADLMRRLAKPEA